VSILQTNRLRALRPWGLGSGDLRSAKDVALRLQAKAAAPASHGARGERVRGMREDERRYPHDARETARGDGDRKGRCRKAYDGEGEGEGEGGDDGSGRGGGRGGGGEIGIGH
jgi:hypothetical protein